MTGTIEFNNEVSVCYIDYDKSFRLCSLDQTNDDTVKIGV